MSGYYPQEYLDSAEDAGARDYNNGITKAPDTYPQKEKDAWTRGWTAEKDKIGLYDDMS